MTAPRTLPAHQILTGDRVNLYGHWHTAGRVTLENGEHESTVHLVLDHGASDADLPAHDLFHVIRTVTHTQGPDGQIRIHIDPAAPAMSPADARVHAAAILQAADDADAANGHPFGLMPLVPDNLADGGLT